MALISQRMALHLHFLHYNCDFRALHTSPSVFPSPDHCLRRGVLPGPSPWVHLRVLQRDGVRLRDRALPQGGERSVSSKKRGPKILEVKFDMKILRMPCFLFRSWVGYEHASYQGQQFVLERGEYPQSDAFGGSNAYHIERMTSFRPIACAVRDNPSSSSSTLLCLDWNSNSNAPIVLSRPCRTTESVVWPSTSVRTSWAVRASWVTIIPPSRPWAGATMKLALSGSSLERECPQPSHLILKIIRPRLSQQTVFCNISSTLPSLSLCDFSTDLCATSILVIVDTSISWSVIVTVGSSNTSGSLAPTARPLRSSPSAVFSSNNLLQKSPFTHVNLHLWPLLLPSAE